LPSKCQQQLFRDDNFRVVSYHRVETPTTRRSFNILLLSLAFFSLLHLLILLGIVVAIAFIRLDRISLASLLRQLGRLELTLECRTVLARVGRIAMSEFLSDLSPLVVVDFYDGALQARNLKARCYR